jgi:hypothetical protein
MGLRDIGKRPFGFVGKFGVVDMADLFSRFIFNVFSVDQLWIFALLPPRFSKVTNAIISPAAPKKLSP